MEVAIARQDMVDLEKVVRRDPETFDQRTLDRLRYFAETNLIILTFQHVYLCERHVGLLLKCRGEDGRGWFRFRPVASRVVTRSGMFLAEIRQHRLSS